MHGCFHYIICTVCFTSFYFSTTLFFLSFILTIYFKLVTVTLVFWNVQIGVLLPLLYYHTLAAVKPLCDCQKTRTLILKSFSASFWFITVVSGECVLKPQRISSIFRKSFSFYPYVVWNRLPAKQQKAPQLWSSQSADEEMND